MKRSPPPLRSAPFSTNSAASQSAELALDAPLHALGERVAGLLHAGQVHEHELKRLALALSVDDPADRPPRGLRLVRDDRHLRADERVDERRLADVRPAGDRDEARARHRLARSSASDAVLQREHLAVVGLVVEARRGAGRRGRPPRPGPRCARGQITTSPSSRGPAAGPAPSTGKDRTSVGSSMPRCSRFSSRIRSGSTSSTVRCPSSMPAARERGERGRPQLGRALELDHGSAVSCRRLRIPRRARRAARRVALCAWLE